MSQADPGRRAGAPYRKPRADVYTVLLTIALLAILVAIVFLYLEIDMYKWQYKGGPSVLLDRPKTSVLVKAGPPSCLPCQQALAGSLV